MKAVAVGDPNSEDTQMGPLAMKRQLERVQGHIAKGVAEGAQLAAGGGRPSSLNQGYFIEPTVFANVTNRYGESRRKRFSGPLPASFLMIAKRKRLRLQRQ